jgi:site-specific recombinase XerC
MADFHDPENPNSIMWADFERDLTALGRSPRTIQSYLEAGQQLADHCKDADLLTLSKGDVLDYLIECRRAHSGATELVRYRSLHRFYAWAVTEGYLDRSPLSGVPAPRIEEKIIPVPHVGDLRELIGACSGTDFDALRDTAIIRLFCECGLRLSELASLRVADLDMVRGQVTVLGKGAKWRQVPFGQKTGKALTRYLRARSRHELAHLESLWPGARGVALTPNGVTQLLRRRCRQAGIAPVHPHQLRHYSASEHFGAGLSDQDAMRTFGWSTLAMPHQYGSHTGTRRAIEHARALAIGDAL